MKKTKNFKKALNKHGQNIVLFLIACMFIWPMLWLVFASFDKTGPITIKIPEEFTLNNYQEVLSNTKNYRSFLNSFIISFTQATFVVILAILAAYPLSRFDLKGKSKIMYSILFLNGLPITALMVPVYVFFFRFKITNSLISTTLFLIATALPYCIWMMKNFMDDVPKTLEEAAWIDGAGFIQTIFHVIFPVILPGVFVVFIYTFSGSWGNFFVPFILLNAAEKLPASVSIYQFFGSHGEVLYGQLAAFSLLYTLPIAGLYFISQRFMSQGFTLGGSIK